jgi:hypothetical protein
MFELFFENNSNHLAEMEYTDFYQPVERKVEYQDKKQVNLSD